MIVLLYRKGTGFFYYSSLLAFFICLAIIFGTLLPLLALGKDTRWY